MDPLELHCPTVNLSYLCRLRVHAGQLWGFSGSPVTKVTNSISGSRSGASSFAPLESPSLPFSLLSLSKASSLEEGEEAPSICLVLVREIAVEVLPMECRVATGTKPVGVSKVYSSGKILFLLD